MTTEEPNSHIETEKLQNPVNEHQEQLSASITSADQDITVTEDSKSVSESKESVSTDNSLGSNHKLDQNVSHKDNDTKNEEKSSDNQGDTQMIDSEPNLPERDQLNAPQIPENTQSDAPQQKISTTVISAKDTKNAIEEKASQFLAKQTYRVIIPSFAAWFDRSKCNEIEKKSLPEFFNNKHRTKTPSIYMEYRNFMVDTFRLNPSEYLTFTACRRNLAGDVAAVMRVFSFLETWGLINYQVDPQTRPSMVGPQFTGHFQVLLDTAKGLVPFIPAKNNNYTQGKSHKSEAVVYKDPTDSESVKYEQPSNSQTNGDSLNGGNQSIDSVTVKQEPKDANSVSGNLSLRRNIYDSTADAVALQDESQRQLNALNTRTYNCYTCGDDTTKIRYHNLRTKQSLSPVCFENGFFPSNFSSADFVKIVKSESSATEWTDQEVLLLIEGVEMYEDDWNAIAYHVGTRTKEACIVKFIQLPIEDPYLVKSFEKQQRSGGTGSKSVGDKITAVQNSAAVTLLDSEPPSNQYQALKEFVRVQKTPTISKEDEEIKTLISERAAKMVETDKSYLETSLGLLVVGELEKLECKMTEFERVEKVLAQEKQALAQAQQQLLYDRLALKRQSDLVLGKLQQATGVASDASKNIDLATANGTSPLETSAVVANEYHKASELAKAAVVVASQPLLRLAPLPVSEMGQDGGTDGTNTDIVPELKPVSMDAPQSFTLWTA